MFDPNKTLVIANPMARHGFVGDNWPTLSAQIVEALGPVNLQLTKSRGDGLLMGKQAIADGARTIISFGGDGTHSEVVDGIMQSGLNHEVTLGILHAGTGGDFRRMIPGAEELETGCAVIRDAPAVPIDIGWVQYQHDDGQTSMTMGNARGGSFLTSRPWAWEAWSIGSLQLRNQRAAARPNTSKPCSARR